MKFSAARTELADAAKWVSRAISRSPKAPVLAGMVVEASEGEVVVSAFDYDYALTARVPAEVGEPGKVVVPGWAFSSFLGAVRGSEVEMSSGDKATVRSGASSSAFQVLTDEYPDLPVMVSVVSGLGTVSGLGDVIARLSGLCGRDVIPPLWQQSFQLEGVHGLTVLAGTRYALAAEPVSADLGEFLSLVPAARFGEALAGMTGDVDLYQHPGALVVSSAGRAAWLREFEGTFPPRALDMLAPSHEATLTVDRDLFLSSLKLAATASDRVRLDIGTDALTVASHQPQKGEAKSDITDVITAEATDPGSLYLSQANLQAILASFAQPVVTINYAPNSAKPCTATDGRTRAVFMPIRVEN